MRFPGESYVELDGDTELFDGVSVLFTPGHSAGHQAVVVENDDGARRARRRRDVLDARADRRRDRVDPSHPRAASLARVPRAPRTPVGARVRLTA